METGPSKIVLDWSHSSGMEAGEEGLVDGIICHLGEAFWLVIEDSLDSI